MKRRSRLITVAVIISMLAACDKPEEENEVITVTDIDGNIYQTVTIGNQTWLAENLKVTHYRDGTAITNVADNAEWATLTTEAYCIYNNNASNQLETYGVLYNWYVVADGRNLAPEGWHVPTDGEWKELEMELGMSTSEADDTGWRGTNEGSKLARNADLWDDGDLKTNSEFGALGFNALPGGERNGSGPFFTIGSTAYFWSATESSSSSAWNRLLHSYYSEVARFDNGKRFGFSVRLLRD